MERFEQAMKKENVAIDLIQYVKTCPIWRERIRNYNPEEIDLFIRLFPQTYSKTLTNPSFYSTPMDFEKARQQYVPMDLD